MVESNLRGIIVVNTLDIKNFTIVLYCLGALDKDLAPEGAKSW